MTPRTALIIGGGPAGLLAAIHLARGGLDVTLLEARAHLGGRASSEARDGLELNQGPHALYLGGAARRELAAVGIDPAGWRPSVLTRSVWLHEGRARRWHGSPSGVAALGRWALRQRGARPDLARVSTSAWLARSCPIPPPGGSPKRWFG